MCDVFLNDNGLINNPPVGQEAGLGRANDILENRLDFVSNYFSNYFVIGVTQAMVLKFLRLSAFLLLGMRQTRILFFSVGITFSVKTFL